MKQLLTNTYYVLAATGFYALAFIPRTFAAFGIDNVNINDLADGTTETSIKKAITDAVNIVLNFLALIAVIVIIIAGIRLIVSQGEDEAKEKAKKAILYALIGLIIVLFAKVIVALVAEVLADKV